MDTYSTMMIRDQLSLFETETHVNNIYITDKPVDVSTLLPEDNVIKGRYFIYPNHGKHPYSAFDKSLNSKEYPFIEDRNYKLTGKKKVLHVILQRTLQSKKNMKMGDKQVCLHKLVGRAFLDPGTLDPYDGYTVVDHIDNKTWNYRLNNLRFVTRSENTKGWKKIDKQEIFEIAKRNRRF